MNHSGNLDEQRIDYREQKESIRKGEYKEHWKKRIWCEMCTVGTQICTILIYLAIFGIALHIDNYDNYDNMTIYTQAIDDWGKELWADFQWGNDGECPDGFSYVDINNYWRGTVEGNYTKHGVEPTGASWHG